MRRVLLQLAIWPVLLLATCSPLPAEQLVPISPEPSSVEPMLPLRICEEELTKLEQKSIAQLTQQESDFAARLRVAVTEAAADAARPLLVELAGVRAERDAWARQVRAARWIGVCGFGFGVVTCGLMFLHFFLPQIAIIPP